MARSRLFIVTAHGESVHLASSTDSRVFYCIKVQSHHLTGPVFVQLRSTLRARAALHIKPDSVSASWLRTGAVAAHSTPLQQLTTKQQLSFESIAAPNNSPQTPHAAGITAAFKRQWQKEGSEQGKSKPTPSWLANLTVFGVGATVVAANTEQVPITGRTQFTLWFLHTPRSSRSTSGHLPETAELHRDEFVAGTALRPCRSAACS